MEHNGSTNGAQHSNGNGAAPDGGPSLGWALDLLVYKPMGIALGIFGQAVTKGCSTLTEAPAMVRQAEAKVRQARTIGQFAVTIGAKQVRKEVDARLGDVCRKAGSLVSLLPVVGGQAVGSPPAPAPPAPEREPEAKATSRATAARTTGARKTAAPRKAAPKKSAPAGPTAAHLPIPSYDGLSASQVVQRLGGLSPDELEAVRAYEAGGRARKTVLAAIERLAR